jgi:hypothetical protein
MPPITSTKRVNFNAPTALVDSWHTWSAMSGFTVTELLTTAMSLLHEVYRAQAAGGRVILVTKEGHSKSVMLPTKSLAVVDVPGIIAHTPTESVTAAPTAQEIGAATA